VLAISANGVALAAVVVAGATALVGTVGGWVFQAWTLRRQFENARLATDLDDLRGLLDDGAVALRRYLGALLPLEAAFDAVVRRPSGGGKDATPDAFGPHEAAELDAAFNAAYRISVRLEIRLGSAHTVVVRYRDALGLIQRTQVYVDAQLTASGIAEIPAELAPDARYAANLAYLEAAMQVVGSSVRNLPMPQVHPAGPQQSPS